MDITKEKPNRTLLVLKYLWDNSDIDHPATIKDIAAYLEGFGYNATRKTISKDIDELIEIGIDIDCKREEHNLYFLDVRVFELAEVKLLVDAVQSSRFIPTKKSKALIEKLSTFVGSHQSSILKRQLYVDKRIKASNEGIFYLVDNIHTAIREKKRITFQYQEYNQNKEKVLKHQGQVYSLSPYALVWNDDCYYVLGYSDSHEKVVKFRVDRMIDMRISEMTAVRKPKDFDVSDYFSQIFSMYDGNDCHVTLLCENELMKHIIDRFGEKVFTAPADDKHFLVETTVSLSQTFYGWVFSFGGKMKITAPQQAIDGFARILEKFK